MSSLYQPFLASVTSEHSLAAPRSHKLLFLLLSALFFPPTQLCLCPSTPFIPCFPPQAMVVRGGHSSLMQSGKQIVDGRVVGRHVDVCFLRIAYSECKLFKKISYDSSAEPCSPGFPSQTLAKHCS